MITLDNDDWNWIKEHQSADPDRLRLSFHGDPRKMFAITQIDCRQRVREKLSQTLADQPDFVFPSTLSAQQSTSDSLASYHASLVNPGWRVLDLTGGLGIDARHLSSRAVSVDICEINPEIAECAEHNAHSAGIENISVHCCDCIDFLTNAATDQFDCIFIDPARRGEHGQRLYALSQCSPDVTELLDKMLCIAPKVIIKASPMLDVSHTLTELKHVEQIITLGTKNECKELIAVCSRDYSEPARISAVSIIPLGISEESASSVSECACQPESFSNPAIGDVVYEPYPSVAKLGMAGHLCRKYNVAKIANATNLYHTCDPVVGFPGTSHRVENIFEMSKKALKSLSGLYPLIDVTAKNFPMTSVELTARMRVKPSGEYRLFACRDAKGRKLLIATRRI